MPEIGEEKQLGNNKQKIDEFLSSIITALVSEHDIENGKIQSF